MQQKEGIQNVDFFISFRSLEIELIEYRTALSGSDVSNDLKIGFSMNLRALTVNLNAQCLLPVSSA